MRAAILVLILLATASTAFGQAKYPAAEHTKDIEDCIKTAAAKRKADVRCRELHRHGR